MVTSTVLSSSPSIRVSMSWLAIASGIVGLFSFACLLVYITSPTLQMQDSGLMSPTGRLLLKVHFSSSIVQTLLMMPVAICLYQIGGRGSTGRNRSVLVLGVVALGGVALLRLVAMINPGVSDILFMIPMGLVGIWLTLVNLDGLQALPRWIRILGGVAGICLFGVGLNFFVNGGMVVFSKGPMAYGDDINFHIGLGLSGFPGFTLFPLWSIMLGRRARAPKNA